MRVPRYAFPLLVLLVASAGQTRAAGLLIPEDKKLPPLAMVNHKVTVTSDTIVAEHEQLARFLTDVATAADRTGDLLLNNDRNIIRANRLARPVVSLLARYSPEFGCFFRGYAKLVPRIHDAVPKTPGLNHAAHVVVEFVPSYPTYSNPIDLPEFKDKRGPNCYGLPNPPMRLPVIRYKDGTEDDPRFDTQGQIGKMLRAAIP